MLVIDVEVKLDGSRREAVDGYSVKLSTIGGRAFPVARPTIWNSLPDNVTSALSPSTFRQRLQTFLFQASFPDIIIEIPVT